MRDDSIYYNVGAMLYCPANNKAILHNLMNNKFGNNFSLIFCLEDSINDNMVEEAESILIDTIKALYKLSLNEDFYVLEATIALGDYYYDRKNMMSHIYPKYQTKKFNKANKKNKI